MAELKSILMIAPEFPPFNFSGSVRPFQFAKHLPDYGFAPLVISQEGFLKYGKNVDPEPLKELRECCRVMHLHPVGLGTQGRRLLKLADEPIRWVTGHKDLGTKAFRGLFRRICCDREWRLLAIATALRLQHKPGFDIVWATAPPWDSLKVGYWVSKLTGKPFVADFRDPWTYGVLWNPRSEETARREVEWEKRVLSRASRIVFTSPLTTEIMQKRCEPAVAARMVTIMNGFADEPDCTDQHVPGDKCILSYVGNLMRRHRQPDILLEGLSIACEDPDLRKDVQVKFVGGMDGYEKEIGKYAMEANVDCVGTVSSKSSIRFMHDSDVLILLQMIAGEGRDVIGGKAYEYLAARRPILGIVPEDGGDAWLIRRAGAGLITGITDSKRVAEGIRHYWELWKHGRIAGAASQQDISQFSRRNLARELAELFGQLL
jgi:hypothetical protein